MVSVPLTAPGISRDGKERLRLWIRLLRASRTIEAELRDRLKKEFDTTLPRFDVMAALYRCPEGMLMSDLSRFLLVSNGNVTGIVDRLVNDKLIIRTPGAEDRRSFLVRLTPKGLRDFNAMAKAHEGWVDELLSEFNAAEADVLIGHLDGLSSRIRNGGTRA